MSSGAQRLMFSVARRAAQERLGLWASAARLQWLPALTNARSFASYPAHVVLNMPSLSPTMTQGNITKWRKQPGEQVAPGQILAEVETDKATIEWEAQEEGYMAKHLVPEGARDIEVGSPVAVLAEDADGVAGLASFTPGGEPPSKPQEAPAAAPAAPKPSPAAAEPAPAAPAPKPAGRLPPHQILNMPALSPTMSQGNILEWKKKVGDQVAPGDVYCEVETDKATISWESQEEGYIAKIMQGDGTRDIDIGTPVLVLVDDKEAVAAFAQYSGEPPAEAPAAPAPAAAAPPAAEQPSAPREEVAAAPQPPVQAAPAAAPSDGRVRASPYARKLAAERGVELQGLTGTGPDGRIVSSDVQGAPGGAAPARAEAAPAAPAAPAAAPTAAPAAPAPAPGATFVDIPHSQIRRVIAKRLQESKQTVPHYYLTTECKVEELLQLRERINAALAGARGGAAGGSKGKLSVNDFVIKAAAKALKTVPGVNASWYADYIRQYDNVDISVAVQTPTGLQVPIVRNADLKSLSAISSDIRALATKAKEGKLLPEEYVGGTFTVSNLGMYGIKQFAAIINPPQSAILAVGATVPVVARVDGVFKEVPTMAVTISCDHRTIDGAMGAEWMQAFQANMENPLTLML